MVHTNDYFSNKIVLCLLRVMIHTDYLDISALYTFIELNPHLCRSNPFRLLNCCKS